ncbi:MAG: inorganic phosphate transporter, partial [Mangrovicoccus sp.]|nr:inorganic phosphate transporter [Mangrovicoccus sp.]
KILLTLIISPVFGFFLAWVLYKAVKAVLRDPALYEPQQPGVVPPKSVRIPLIGGLIGVSFLHGSNDGQKSIGLMLMVLMGLAPGLYAIDPVKDQASYQETVAVIEELEDLVAPMIGDPRTPEAALLFEELAHLRDVAQRDWENRPISEEEKIQFRAEILDVHEVLGRTLKSADSHQMLSHEDKRRLHHAYDFTTRLIENVPFWLICLSAIALGLGTMIGYEKIVKTLGEKMGDKHMSAAQGVAAQASAMAAIAAADMGGVPVSTTHVLTAGVAGSVQSSGDQVQWNTIARILVTWFTTLPGTLLASFLMALILHTALV